MTKLIEAMTTPELASAFNEATVRKWGTDEAQVFRILAEVKRRGSSAKDEFRRAVASDLTPSQRQKFFKMGGGDVIHGIFRDEFSPTFSRADLEKAERLWDGYAVHRAADGDHLVAGMTDAVDLSDAKAKWKAAGTAVGVGLVMWGCPPAGLAIIGVMALFGLHRAEKGMQKARMARTVEERQEGLRMAGQGTAQVAMSALPLRGARGRMNAWNAARNAESLPPAAKIPVVESSRASNATPAAGGGTPLNSGYFMTPARPAPGAASGSGLQTAPSMQASVPVSVARTASAARPAAENLVYDQLPTVVPIRAPGLKAPSQIEPSPPANLRISNPQAPSFRAPIGDSKENPVPMRNPDPRSGETMRVSGLKPWMEKTLEPGQIVFVNGEAVEFKGIENGRAVFEKNSVIGSVALKDFAAENFAELPVSSIRPTENGLSKVRLEGAGGHLDEPVRVFRRVDPDTGETAYYAMDGHHRLKRISEKEGGTARVRFEDRSLEDVREKISKNATPQFPVPKTVAELRVNPGRIDNFQGEAAASSLDSNGTALQWVDFKLREARDESGMPSEVADGLRTEFLGNLDDLVLARGKDRLEELNAAEREEVAAEFIRRVEARVDEVLGEWIGR